jgi:hypothetical protein
MMPHLSCWILSAVLSVAPSVMPPSLNGADSGAPASSRSQISNLQISNRTAELAASLTNDPAVKEVIRLNYELDALEVRLQVALRDSATMRAAVAAAESVRQQYTKERGLRALWVALGAVGAILTTLVVLYGWRVVSAAPVP